MPNQARPERNLTFTSSDGNLVNVDMDAGTAAILDLENGFFMKRLFTLCNKGEGNEGWCEEVINEAGNVIHSTWVDLAMADNIHRWHDEMQALVLARMVLE